MFFAIHNFIVLISIFDGIFIKEFPFYWKLQLNFLILGTALIKIKEKNKLKLALTNPLVVIDRMDDCLAMYHKKFDGIDAHCISFVSAQCLGRCQF